MSLRATVRTAVLTAASGMSIIGLAPGWAAWLFGFLAGFSPCLAMAVQIVQRETVLGRMRWTQPPWPSEERTQRTKEAS